MSRFHRFYARLVTAAFAFTAGAAAGVQGIKSRPQAGRWQVLAAAAPNLAVNTAWLALFAGARRDIWLSAGRLDSTSLLDALDQASIRGVSVHLTLSPRQNPDPNRGSRAWLRLRTGIRDTRVAAVSFVGAACAVDDRACILSAQDLLSAEATEEDGGVFLFAANSDLAFRLHAQLAAQHAEAVVEARP